MGTLLRVGRGAATLYECNVNISKITFIRPNLYADRSADALEPVVFAILRGLTPADIECVLYDERVEELPLEDDTDLVAITVETFTARRAYQIASHYARRGVPVVLGGYHPTFCVEEALRYANTVVVGDAETVWPQLLRDASDGWLQRVYRGMLGSLENLRVDRSIYAGKKYGPVTLLQYGRGCKYACDFCSIHSFYGNSLRWRSLDGVVEEIAQSRRRFVFLTDDNLFNDRQKVSELLSAIRPLGIRWACQTSVDIAADRALVQEMAASGCLSVMIGFESLDRDNLQQMRKSWQRRYGNFDELIKVFRDYGIMVYGGFVLGYDHDTTDAFSATLDFAVRNKLFLANFNPLTPTPGTRLYDRLRSEDRLLRDPWWLHPEYRYGDGLFQPAQMTPEELMHGCYWARTQFNSISSIVRRGVSNCRSPMHTVGFVLANLASRQEIHRKQGRQLGDPGASLSPVFESEQACQEAACTP